MKFVGNLLKQHLQRYPQMELTDIYKLLHQAATGAAHAAPIRVSSAAHAAPIRVSSAAHAAPIRVSSAAHAAAIGVSSAANAAPVRALDTAHSARASVEAAHSAPASASVDATSVLAALQAEMRAMGDGPDEPLLDPISPDGQLARIHLRTYAASGRRLEALAAAFVATLQQPAAGYDKLARFCACLGDFADTGEIAFDADSVRAYFDQIAAQGYPAVHHSALYRSAYRPAYRIVNIDYLSL
jgi:hypothetical protein